MHDAEVRGPNRGRPVDRWRPRVIAAGSEMPTAPVIAPRHIRQLSSESVYWDLWPVQLDDGALATVAGGSLWIALSAPRSADPDERHFEARMRLLHRVGDHWQDCGVVLPDGFAPGTREWSGSARLDADARCVTLWFTAAGRRGETPPSFEQRVFRTIGALDCSGPLPVIAGWSEPVEAIVNDGALYADLSVNQGVPGAIKGFRDPYWFRDPADGQGYLLFTGSKPAAASESAHDGVVGIAASVDADGLGQAVLLPPLVDADGVVNELERPHVIVHRGRYYLFWSSHRLVFVPDRPDLPTGLYGMVAPSLFGPWEPLNGTGLVLANPMAEPRQAYAWQVIPGSFEVVSFVDYWGLDGRDISADPALKAERFGGTIAPSLWLEIEGTTTRLIGHRG